MKAATRLFHPTQLHQRSLYNTAVSSRQRPFTRCFTQVQHSHSKHSTLSYCQSIHLTTNTHSSSFSSPFQLRSAHFDASIGLTTDQLDYQRVALDFAQQHLAPHAQRWDAESYFPIDVFKQLAQLGFAGVYVREDVGGSALTRSDAAVIFESLASGDVSVAAYLTIHNMCAWIVDQYGSDAIRQEYLPRMTSMQLFASYCLTEANSGSDAASLVTRAKYNSQDQTYTLNGSKCFISGGSVSSVYIVMARCDDNSISCFLVDTEKMGGVSFGPLEHKMGWRNMPTCVVQFDDVKVPGSHLLGKKGEGFKIAMRALDGGRINIATTSCGGALTALNKAIDHVCVRKQFNTLLKDFQHTQFTIADLVIHLQSARLMIQSAAQLLDAKDSRATLHCAAAKKHATEVGFNIANASLQLFGGYGYLRDYEVERIVRDLRVHQILEGTNEIMKLIVARQQLKD